jgi:hypothetical protein
MTVEPVAGIPQSVPKLFFCSPASKRVEKQVVRIVPGSDAKL